MLIRVTAVALLAACSNTGNISAPGDPGNAGDVAHAGGDGAGDPTTGDPLLGDPAAGDPPAGDPDPGATPAGIYIGAEEVLALPITGDGNCDAACSAAWDDLVTDAATATATPNLRDQNEMVGQYAMLKALVWVRTGNTTRRDEVVQILQDVVGTEAGAEALAVGRELAAYVIAADLVGLPQLAPTFDADTFRPWLSDLIDTTNLSGRTLESCHQDRPNNWGLHCGASRAAAAAYLADHGDPTEQAKGEAQLADTAVVFEGWLGDRSAYASFSYGLLGWQCDQANPVGVNPAGCVVDGHNYDGIMPDDQRRADETRGAEAFTWPPEYTHYSYGALEGGSVLAEILHRRGHPVWSMSDQALRRAVDWLWYDGDGKDRWDTCSEPEDERDKRMVLDILDRAYGTQYIQTSACYAATEPSPIGRNVAGTSWTHQVARGRTAP